MRLDWSEANLRRLAWWVWGAIVLAICVRVMLASPRTQSVYPIYVAAADHFQRGNDLYGILEPGLDVWRYHPVIAAAFTPFASLPMVVGAILWRLLNVLIFFIGLKQFHRHVLHQRIPLPALALLALPLCMHSINNAQANVLLLGLLLGGVAMVAAERWWWAATVLSSAALLKAYPVALILLLSLYAPTRLGLRCLLLITLGWLAPFLVQTSDYVMGLYRSWFHVMQLDNRLIASLERCTVDAYMVCRVWWMAPSIPGYRLFQMGMALCAALLCWQARGHSERYRLAFDVGCLWMILFGPATESCTYALLSITLARGWWESRSPVRVYFTLSASIFLYTLCAGALPKHLRLNDWALPAIAGLVLLAGVLAEWWSMLRSRTGAVVVARENDQVSSRALVEPG